MTAWIWIGNIPCPAEWQEIIIDRRTNRILLFYFRPCGNNWTRQGRKDGKSYLLTIAGAVSSSYLDRIELTRILPLVDYIFLMSYDMHGPWDTFADFNAPLYTPSGSTPHYQNSVNDAIHLYLRRGASASKLVLGMPFYGYKYQGVSKEGNGLYSRFSSASSLGYAQLVKGYIDKAGYSRFEHKETGVPYLYGNNTFISYDDPASIAAKVRLGPPEGAGGGRRLVPAS